MELLLSHNLDLPEDLFRLIRDLIYQRSGIFFSDTSKYLLQKRLSARARELSFDSFRQYYYFLMYDAGAEQEFDRIYDLVTTNETYFFREGAQLKAFIEEIVPELVAARGARGGRPKVRVWSAGCSSGEEPYTLAMLLLENDVYAHADVDIFASDINQQVITKARKGIYRENSFRQTEPHQLAKYFTPEGTGTWKIQDRVKNLVSFGRLNLYDSSRVSLLGMLDVIFCRNVIIYFDDESKKKVIETFHNRLVDGGYLLLGHSESLISLSTSFRLRHLKNDMVYQKSSRVLVVDDSAFNRLTLSRMLEEDPEIKVVATAVDGEDGIKKLLQHKPDVVTCDLEMPRMDGFSLLRWVMQNLPTPVIVVSSREDDRSVFKALELGALDFIAKPSARASHSLTAIKESLLAKVRAVPQSKLRNLARRSAGQEAPAVPAPPVPSPYRVSRFDVVVIGASTGGPPALQGIFTALPSLPVAFIVAQHMPAVFTRLFAERVNRFSPMNIKEAQSGERMEPATVYVAPGGLQTRVERSVGDDVILRTLERSTGDVYAPSVNQLFESAAKALGGRVLGVILTGMGDDGKNGMQAIKRAGGTTIAESEESAIVFGMPGESIRAGAVDHVVPLELMAEEILLRLQN